jgi:hypothetical protein
VLALITGVNLRGIVESARAFIVPTAVFVASIPVLIAVGFFRSAPVSTAAAAGHASVLADNATTVGALLLLKASPPAAARSPVWRRWPTPCRPSRAAEAAGPRQLPPARLRPEGRPARPLARCVHAGPGVGGPARVLRRTNTLVPLFAIGVFIGFTIAQVRMVRHWRGERGRAH